MIFLPTVAVDHSEGFLLSKVLCYFRHSEMQCHLWTDKTVSIYIHQEQVSLLKRKWVLVTLRPSLSVQSGSPSILGYTFVVNDPIMKHFQFLLPEVSTPLVPVCFEQRKQL